MQVALICKICTHCLCAPCSYSIRIAFCAYAAYVTPLCTYTAHIILAYMHTAFMLRAHIIGYSTNTAAGQRSLNRLKLSGELLAG